MECMTIEASLQLMFGQQVHILTVKMIRIESASYFFIRDKEFENPLLGTRILELTYTDDFSLTEFGGVVRSPDIPEAIILAIQNELLKNSKLWF